MNIVTDADLDELNADSEPWMAPDAEVDAIINARLAHARSSALAYADLSLSWEGHNVVRHGIHQLTHSALDACRAVGKHCVLVEPPEHGKTSQVAKWLVFQLAQNPRLRIGLVSDDWGLAKRNLIAIRKALMSRLTRVLFPQLKPDTRASKSGGGWSKEVLYLEGNNYPSVEVFPLDGAAEGVRLDILWLDDAVSRKCKDSEALRKRAHSAIHNTYLSRLTAGGMAVVTNNCWHREDSIHKMLSSESFMVLWLGYREVDSIYWRVHHPAPAWKWGVEGELSLWSIWPRERLINRRGEDALTYKRLYNQRALLAEECRFPPVNEWGTYHWDELLLEYERGGRIYAFLDPSGGRNVDQGDFAALVIVMIAWSKVVYVLDVWVKRAIPQEQIEILWIMHAKWKRLLGGAGIEMAQLELLPKDQDWITPSIQAMQAKHPDEQLWVQISHPTIHKNTRIDALNAPMRNGYLRFPWNIEARHLGSSEDAASWRRLISQMEDFGAKDAENDDAPDALAGAWKAAVTYGPQMDSNTHTLMRQQREEENNRIRVPNCLTGKPESEYDSLIGARDGEPYGL